MLRCLSLGPAQVLGKLGFVQDGLVFRRDLGEVQNIIEVHLSDEGVLGDGWFVFELGAEHRRVRKALGHRKLEISHAGSCTLETRLNRSDDDNDTWWMLTSGHERPTARHAAHRLGQTVEKWFSVANDLTAINELLKGPHEDFWSQDSLVPAAIAMVLGDKELARQRLEAELKSIHDWRAERLERFRRNDPYGTAVLATAHFLMTGKRTKRFNINQYEWDQLRY